MYQVRNVTTNIAENSQLDDRGHLVLQALESLCEQGRIGIAWLGVPLQEIVENAGEILGGDWFEDDDFDNRIEAGMRQLMVAGIAEGPTKQLAPDKWRQPTNWWADTTVFTLCRGYKTILASLPVSGSEILDEAFVGERLRPSALAQ
jgi:hypothetical protein